MMRKHDRAVFLDRDGVIVREVDYLRHPKDLRLLRGSARAIRALKKAGFKLIVITNQSAIARGYLTLAQLTRIHRKLQYLLRLQNAALDAIYFCPHHPQAGARIRCLCRKPGTALLKKAADRFGIDIPSSYFIGDATTDVLTAKKAGCRSILVRTGYGGKDGVYKAKPDFTCENLAAAAKLIFSEENRNGKRQKT
ncbi:MAG: D-glycero-alpha-D-manno-heptose-1,7-bisphosphate 7-phosphatase [Elusimicrobiota bacterium]